MAATCDACGFEAFGYNLNEDGQLVPECLTCGHLSKPVAPEEVQLNVANPLGQTDDKPKRVAKVKPAAKPDKPVDVLKLARARLRELKTEIARLHRLEKERDQLERLLAAANSTETKREKR